MPTPYARTATGDRAGYVTIAGGLLLVGAFVVDAATGAFTVEGVPASTEWLAAYALLTLGSLLLVGGLAGIAAASRRTFGIATVVGAAVGFLSVAVGAGMNLVYDGPAGETTTGGGFVFVGMVLVVFATLVTGVALWRLAVARVAAGLMVAGVLAFLTGFVVGVSLPETTGVDVAWTLFGVLMPLGWALFGNYVRTDHVIATEDLVTSVA